MFLMIEEDFIGYFLASVVRAALGRRTVGLLFRGREAALGGTFRMRLKRALLKALRQTPKSTSLSIVPFSIEPRLAEVADGWIDDIQLWDVEDLVPPPSRLSGQLVDMAAGRGLVVSLGAQSASKGLDFFTSAWCSDPDLRDRWLFVVAGEVGQHDPAQTERFSSLGGVIVDRLLSDAELASLYAVASVVWVIYSPEYNQASGIFGRAVQYDRPILVRRGAAIESHAIELGARAVAVDFGEVSQVPGALSAAVALTTIPHVNIEAMRRSNLGRIFSALQGRN
ncbi:MAG: hypothetical protein KJ676_09020 [Alphaproteobacteria bacterium]|nr:hypothetical protein [Alphaproteobacteria bacterium]MBU1525489.1 hypothetical protein [Alphaproteobacteria bacterium]MBU2115975.1 hypothetical protein [Alphaproteobacteria bacterium]MBU2350891.1 hypothetical protein [Alphaproteobacteria bacterium]MBU2381728.1 hypothetical protein [Alphaproteobacteria bacterium]